jgi:hypothetical protein
MSFFKANPSFESEMDEDPETKRALQEFADAALEVARSIAPVSGGPKGGEFRDSLFADEDGLGSTSSTWHIHEYGTVDEPPQAILRNAVAAVGVTWTDA